MERSNSDWYLVIIVAVLTTCAGGAVFYLQAFTAVDSQWFQTIGTAGFGGLLALLTQKVVVGGGVPPDNKENQ